jgi:hypothetical protein
MPVPHAMLVVEGLQDAECVGKLIAPSQFKRITRSDDLPAEWRVLVNTTFPAKGRGIDQPHTVPRFYRSEAGTLIAIIIAGSDSQLASALAAQLDVLKDAQDIPLTPAAVGYILDRDHKDTPAKRHSTLLEKLTKFEIPFAFPQQPGTILPNITRTGVFIVPDNNHQGTLEDLLLQTGAVAYAPQLEQATQFVDGFDKTGFDDRDTEEGLKPSGRKKQIVGTLAAMLKPGRALATTLQDNRWLKGDALNTSLALGLRKWLHELLDLPSP